MTPPKPSQHRKYFKGKSILKKRMDTLDSPGKPQNDQQLLKDIKIEKKEEGNQTDIDETTT